MKVNYKGFDTCYVVECANFYYNSDMPYSSDCLGIAFRKDIRAKWKQSHERGLISESALREKMRIPEYTKISIRVKR